MLVAGLQVHVGNIVPFQGCGQLGKLLSFAISLINLCENQFTVKIEQKSEPNTFSLKLVILKFFRSIYSDE